MNDEAQAQIAELKKKLAEAEYWGCLQCILLRRCSDAVS